MIDYLGLIIAGLSTFFFSMKNPWERRIKMIKLPFGYIGVLFLIAGIIVSGITTHFNNLKKKEYKNQIDTIDINVKNTLSTTHKGFNSIYREYEGKMDHLIKKYDTLISTIIDQSDSSLNSQLLKIRQDYQKLHTNYLNERDISQRYYFSEQWPWSDKKNEEVSGALFFFIPTDISGLLTGPDRFIIWYLIERNGSFPYSQTGNLHDELWAKLKPMKLSLGINLKRLEVHQVIKPDYWNGNIEFTEYFTKRLEAYKEYKNTDMYVKKMFELERDNR